MKKVLLAAVVVFAAVVFAVVLGFNSIEASNEIGQTPVDWDHMINDDYQEPIPMWECATIKCGACPGPKCNIDGICCHVPDSIKPGLARCGCTANNEPVCNCDVGVPR